MAPRVFSCSHCDYKNQYLNNVKTHINRFHNKKNSTIHKCKFCGDISDNLLTMNAHIAKCTSNPNVSQGSQTKKLQNGLAKTLYDCFKCGYQSDVPGIIINHMIQVHNIAEPKIYKCPLCSQKFRTLRQLEIHEEECTNVENKNNDIINGNGVGKIATPQEELEIKINRKTTVKIKLHKIDGPSENNSLPPPSKTKEKFKCLKCDFKAHQSFQLLKHVNTVHKISEPVTTHKCRLCLQGFQNIMLLNSHIRTKCGTMVDVSKIKREEFKCSKCKYKTYRSHQLNRHMLMIHTENNGAIFKCKCKEIFPSAQKLKSHSKVCSKIKSDVLPMKVIDVKSKTIVKNGVKTMKSILSKKEPVYHNCPQCSFRTEHKNLLRSHKNSEHKKVSTSHLSAYTCEICKEGFQYITEFKPHVMKCKQINGVSNGENRRKVPTPRTSLDSAPSSSSSTTRKSLPIKKENCSSNSTLTSPVSRQSAVSIKRERVNSFSTPTSTTSKEYDVPIKRERGSSFPTPISSTSRRSAVLIKRENDSPLSTSNSSVSKIGAVTIKREPDSSIGNSPKKLNFLRPKESIVKDVKFSPSEILSMSKNADESIAKSDNCYVAKKSSTSVKLEIDEESEEEDEEDNVSISNEDTEDTAEDSGVEMFNCLSCSYKSKYSWAVRVHMSRTHQINNPKIHKCKFCGIMLQHLRDLRYHVGKNYCVNTNAEFARQKQAAEKIRRYNCSRCDYKGAYTHAIRGHMKRKHGMSGFIFRWCQVCREVFVELEQFETHNCVKKDHTKNGKTMPEIEEPKAAPFVGPFFVCSRCEKTFDTKENLIRHRKSSDCAKLGNTTPEPFPKFIKLALRPLSKRTVRVLSSPKHSIAMRNRATALINRACSMMTAKKSKIVSENEATSSSRLQIQNSSAQNDKHVKQSRTKPKQSTSSEIIDNEVNSLSPHDDTQVEFADNIDNEHKQNPISSGSDFHVENHESENMLQEYLGVETISIKKISLTDFSTSTPDFMPMNIASNAMDLPSSAIPASSHSADADHDSSADDEKVFHEMTSFPPVDISYFSPDEMGTFPSNEMTCFGSGEMGSFLPDSAYYSINSEVGSITNADSGDALFNTFEFYNDVDISKNMLVSDNSNSNDQPTNSNLNVNSNSGLMINGDVTWNNSTIENGVSVGDDNEYEFRL